MATLCKKLDGCGVHNDDVPFLSATGSFYEVGYDIGKAFSNRIKGFWAQSLQVQNVLIPYAATENGKKYYETTLDVTKSAFPQYIKEIQGMADGSGIPFEHLFLLCSQKEILNILAPALRDTSVGCTDIMINTPKCKIVAHNEDSYHLIDKFGYIVSVRIIENGQEVENFTSYCYPGELPGSTSAFNRHGMVFSSNALNADHVVENAPTRVLLARSIIKAKNIEEVKVLAKNSGFGVAYGFAFNIADVKDPSKMWCLEIGPQAGESKTHVYTLHEEADASKPGHYIHTNTMQFLSDVKAIDDLKCPSSRLERARQMDHPKTREDALTILGDTANKEYPIFRTTADLATTRGVTIYTAVFDILENRVDFYHGAPIKNGYKPSFHFQIKDDGN